MIPKLIHYCWLSGGPIPPAYARCMDTWREKLQGYEFMLWDTKRFGVESVPWTRQAMETGLYACAADYIRLYAVYSHGGIYLDMDMEVVKPFDGLLDTGLLLARENHVSDYIEAGCFGAVKGHPYIERCMTYIESHPLFRDELLPEIMKLEKTQRHEFINPPLAPEIMAASLREWLRDAPDAESYRVYGRDYFTAKNVVTGAIETTSNTYTIHHFAALYHSAEWREARELKQRICARFGLQSPLVKALIKLLSLYQHVEENGLWKTIRYVVSKYIVNRKRRRGDI